MALPTRSTRIRAAAVFQSPARASNGTDSIWMKYPKSVIGQNFCVR